MIKKIGVNEKTKTPAYLNTETGLVSFGCGLVETITDDDLPVQRIYSDKDIIVVKKKEKEQ